MQYFVDRVGVLGKHRRTATGGFVVDATLARVGVLEYDVAGKRVRRFNPPEVLQASLDGIATAPVTNRHPAKFVTTDTYQKVAAGHVVGSPRFEDGHIHATLAIHDAKLISDIETGAARDVSMGYMATNVERAGAAEDGSSYDEVRVEIVWNHIAVVPAGRAGHSVRLQLDSYDIPDEEAPMKFTIDGVEVEADKAQSAFDSLTGKLEGRLAVAEQALATAQAKAKEATDALAVAQSDEAIDKAVQTRLNKKAAEDAAASKLEAVKKAFPGMKLEGRSQDSIDALYEVATAKAKEDPEGLNELSASTDAKPKVVAPSAPKVSSRQRMLQEQRATLGKIDPK